MFLEKTKYFYSLLAVLLVLSFFPIGGLISILVVTLLISYYLNLGENFSLFTRFILSLVVLFCSWGIIGIIFWALSLKIYIPILVLIEIFILFLLRQKNNNLDFKKTKLFNKSDLGPIFSVIISAFILLVILIHSGLNTSTLIRFNTVASDDIAHLGLVERDYTNRGYVYGPISVIGSKILNDHFANYPQGWHLSTSIIWRSISNNIYPVKNYNGVKNLLILFTLTRIIFFEILIFLISRLIIDIFEFIFNKKSNWLTIFQLVTIVTFIQLDWLFEILRSDFSPFVYQLIIFSVLLLLTFRYLADKKIELSKYIILSSVLIAGLSLDWIITLPLGGMILFIGFYVKDNSRFLNKMKLLFSQKNLIYALLSLVVLAIGFLPIFIQLLWGEKINDLNFAGGIYQIPTLEFILFAALSIIMLFLTKKRDLILKILVSAIVPCAILTGAIFLYLFYSQQVAGYYYIKTSWILYLSLLIFGSVSIIYIIDYASKYITSVVSYLLLVSILFFIVSVFNGSIQNIYFIKPHFWHVNKQIGLEMDEALKIHFQQNKNVLIYSNDEIPVVQAYSTILNVIIYDKIENCGSFVSTLQYPKSLIISQNECFKSSKYDIFSNGNESMVHSLNGYKNITILN